MFVIANAANKYLTIARRWTTDLSLAWVFVDESYAKQVAGVVAGTVVSV